MHTLRKTTQLAHTRQQTHDDELDTDNVQITLTNLLSKTKMETRTQKRSTAALARTIRNRAQAAARQHEAQHTGEQENDTYTTNRRPMATWRSHPIISDTGSHVATTCHTGDTPTTHPCANLNNPPPYVVVVTAPSPATHDPVTSSHVNNPMTGDNEGGDDNWWDGMEPAKVCTKHTHDNTEGATTTHSNQPAHGGEPHPCHNSPNDASATYHTFSATASHVLWALGGATCDNTAHTYTDVTNQDGGHHYATIRGTPTPSDITIQHGAHPSCTTTTTIAAINMCGHAMAAKHHHTPPQGMDQPCRKLRRISTEHSPDITGIHAHNTQEQDCRTLPLLTPIEYRNTLDNIWP